MDVNLNADIDYAGDGLDCGQVPAALLLAADRDLSMAEIQCLERHLTGCAPCRALQDRFLAADRLLGACRSELDRPSPPEAAGAGRSRQGPFAASGAVPRFPWRWAAAAASTVLGAAVFLASGPHPAKPPVRPRINLEVASERVEVIRIELPLPPIGNPFLDDSEAPARMVADVVIGADGAPRDVRLTN